MTFLALLAVSDVAPFLFGVLFVSAGLAFIRLARGPSLADRVVALEVIAAIVVGITLVAALDNDQTALVDVALLLALVSFITTLAFARFVLGTARRG